MEGEHLLRQSSLLDAMGRARGNCRSIGSDWLDFHDLVSRALSRLTSRIIIGGVAAGASAGVATLHFCEKCEVAHTSPRLTPLKSGTRIGTRTVPGTGARRGTWHRNQNQLPSGWFLRRR